MELSYAAFSVPDFCESCSFAATDNCQAPLTNVTANGFGVAGSYGTWTTNTTDNCPVTSGGVQVDGWVQIDAGNEYAMMKALSYQPISVSIAVSNSFFGYNVSSSSMCISGRNTPNSTF